MRRRLLLWLVMAALALALLGVPYVSSGYILRLLTTLFTFAVMAEAWNLIGGFTGYADFGVVVFFGLGGYTTALLMVKLHAPFGLAFLAGGVLCGLFAVLIGLPVLRLRGHYFGIATLGVSQAIREVVSNWTGLTGGGSGVSLPIPDFSNNVFYYMMLGLLLTVLLITWGISRNRFGFGLMAIRENEQAAQVMGVDSLRHKVTAYALSGTLVGLVGGIHAYWISFIDPSTVFDVGITVQTIITVVLGGSGTVFGPMIGAFLLTIISEVLNGYVPSRHVTVLGAIIVVVVLFIPHGTFEYFTRKRRLSWSAVRATLAETRV